MTGAHCWCGSPRDTEVCLASPHHDPDRLDPNIEPKRLYLSGPMSNMEDANYPAFYRAALVLRSAGYEVTNPAETGAIGGQYEDLLRKDLRLLLDCEGVAVLEGWWKSRGASLETSVAGLLSMPVRTVSDWVQRAQVDGQQRTPD